MDIIQTKDYFEAHEHNLHEIFYSTKKFIVPDYQRKYAWTIDQLDQFWDDFIKTYESCYNVVEVVDAKRLEYNGYHFYLSHYPTFTANLEKESLKKCTINLYGHTHQKSNFYNDIPFMYHVGVDSHNCTPVLLDDIIAECEAKVVECKKQL